jgi:tetratricopeptide (TPR) repeat protein
LGVRAKRLVRVRKRVRNMSSSRIEILNQLLAQNPASSFARYGLAMELLNAGELSRAAAEFETLLEADPAYAAAYYHGGQTLEKLGRLDAARDYYRRGIEAARDPHARSELQAALDILGD